MSGELSGQEMRELEEVIDQYSEVECAVLFGSQASGEVHEDSDVDIAIKLNRGGHFVREDIRAHLEQELGRDDIDLHRVERMKEGILCEALDEGTTFGGCDDPLNR